MYVLSSHGDYSKETLKSCEMITGELNDFATVSFHDPMGVDDVVNKYEKLYKNNSTDSFNIITDIKNGTPANSAMLFKDKHKEVRVFAGLSLSLLLTIATGTPIEEAIKENRKVLGEIDPQKEVAQELNDSDVDTTSTKNPIVNVRVDARLIHGQVATMWTRKLNATRIMVIDNEIVKSDVQKMTLKTAVPRGVHLSILTSQGAAKRLKDKKYQGQRVFILVRDPSMLQGLVEQGVKLDSINVGNMSMSENARQIAKSVAVTDEDQKIFDYLSSQNIELYHQMVPNDNKQEFMNLLKKGRK
ncbi:phosphoenolpyruvate-dependent sugar phosphotransferase system EIIAB, probable mannose specific [Companilactobacillus tucceti DSM 20183]|uniref:Phosphoenolpyruvate-dependent sugar phosphotransferase system EIIAB, probable mannose specific n=1 Tax=Companilactobacillus tucceti DSM 20183 TaxID=1423811 RepID=A0A0R1J6Q3_9LACO|nr:PTS mannose/fructose/sorbose transporter subunit IIAB [Companilactobacillus tucceti]KRK64521.1 phosphoenolpyruvate-dependent sugar phosphotransferase system EIIAB, probable mannose specific [Companilactobacillus tucceti DSM 20183]